MLRNKSDWAFIVIDDQHGLTVMIHSSFGNWNFTWTQPGEDVVKFLKYTSVSYSFGKLSNALRMGLPNKYVTKEMNEYKDFYEKFWQKMVEEYLTQNQNN